MNVWVVITSCALVGYGVLSDTAVIWRFHGAMYDAVTIAKILAYTLSNPKLMHFKQFSQGSMASSHTTKVTPFIHISLVPTGSSDKHSNIV